MSLERRLYPPHESPDRAVRISANTMGSVTDEVVVAVTVVVAPLCRTVPKRFPKENLVGGGAGSRTRVR